MLKGQHTKLACFTAGNATEYQFKCTEVYGHTTLNMPNLVKCMWKLKFQKIGEEG